MYDCSRKDQAAIYTSIDDRIVGLSLTAVFEDNVTDLRSQLAVIWKVADDIADSLNSEYDLKGKLVIPCFDWENWNNSQAKILNDELTRRTAVSTIFAVIGTIG